MITKLFSVLLKAALYVKDHPQILFVLILLIVFPILFLYTGQQFLDVGRANQETLQQQRVGLALSRPLQLPGCFDAGPNPVRGLAGNGRRELGLARRRHLELDVDAIGKRPRDAPAVAGDALRGAAAAPVAVAAVPAGAGIHCRDELKIGRKSERSLGAADGDNLIFHRLAHHFEEGGWGMYPILFWSIIEIGIIVERSLYLFGSSINKDMFLATMQKCILAGDVAKAVKMCSAANAPMARIVQAGLLKVNRPDEEVQAAMDEAALVELPVLLGEDQVRINPRLLAGPLLALLCLLRLTAPSPRLDQSAVQAPGGNPRSRWCRRRRGPRGR